MLFKICFSMTWHNRLSPYVIFQIRKDTVRIGRPEVYVVVCLVIFLFNQSKNNAVLEPRKERF